jgi:hypothetical protein
VYGLRPLTDFVAGERVRDSYPLSGSLDAVSAIRYGLYTQSETGEFVNTLEQIIEVTCER